MVHWLQTDRKQLETYLECEFDGQFLGMILEGAVTLTNKGRTTPADTAGSIVMVWCSIMLVDSEITKNRIQVQYTEFINKNDKNPSAGMKSNTCDTVIKATPEVCEVSIKEICLSYFMLPFCCLLFLFPLGILQQGDFGSKFPQLSCLQRPRIALLQPLYTYYTHDVDTIIYTKKKPIYADTTISVQSSLLCPL